MSILPGTRLGPYEILDLLGSGGMGDVYRARDPRLGRTVAIKVLPESAAADADRLRRFEVEAQAAGALGHPNVLVIYDIGRHDDVPYLVSELLEGETLREYLIGTGAVPHRRALDWAAQIAAGLAAAHDSGIVHRDLKPDNLFLRRDGRIKILDFGLAKLVTSPTCDELTDARTQSGMVLGTVGYMAPEQVRGQPAGPPADIFALGIVIYEMLAGTAPYRRETAAETLTAILKDDPVSLPSTVPPAVDRVVRRCLEKRPEDRFRSAHDLGFALEALSGDSGSVSAVSVSAPSGSGLSRRKLVLGSAAAVALAGAGVGALAPWRTRSIPALAYQRLTFRRGLIRTARFGPDYRTVLYGALYDGDLCRVYTVRPDSPESAPLNLPPAAPLAVSRSGELALALGTHLRGIMTYGTLARVPLVGGAPRELIEGIKYADWSPDGAELAVVRRVGRRDVLEFPAGRVIAEPPTAQGGFGFVRVSPQGDRVAAVELVGAGGLQGSVIVADRAGAKRFASPVYFNVFGLAWNGDEVWFTAADELPLFRNTIHALGPDGATRVVARMPGNVTMHDVTPGGQVLIAYTIDRSGIAVVAPGDEVERDFSWLDSATLADLSRDGRTILFTEAGVGGGPASSVYVRSTDGAPAVRLGDGIARALSPDGRWVIAGGDSAGVSRYLDLLPTGPGDVRRIEHPGYTYAGVRWLLNGTRAIVNARPPNGESRLYSLDVLGRSGATLEPVTPEGVAVATGWAVSPDGTMVAVTAERGVVIYSVTGGPPRDVPGLTAGERLLGWIETGLLVSDDPSPFGLGQILQVDPVSGQRAPWRRIVPRDPAGLMNIGVFFSATPDGSAYAYNWHRALSDLFLVDGLR
jgi:hypothetical protein